MGIPQEIHIELNKHTAFAVDTIAKTLAVASQTDAGAVGIRRTLARYRRVLAWFGSAAAEVGAARVAGLCDLLDPHLVSLELQDRPLTKDECRLLTSWPSLVSQYSQAPYDEGSRRKLIAFLCDSEWDSALSESEAISMLAAVEGSVPVDYDLGLEIPGVGNDPHDVLQIDAALAAQSGCHAPVLQSCLPDPLARDLPPVGMNEILSVGTVANSSEDGGASVFDCIDELTQTLSLEEGAEEPSSRLEHLARTLQALAGAAETAGVPGLIDVCALVTDRIEQCAPNAGGRDQLLALLGHLPLVLMDYVVAPEEEGTREALLDYLRNDRWGVGMRDDEVELLRLLLQPQDNIDIGEDQECGTPAAESFAVMPLDEEAEPSDSGEAVAGPDSAAANGAFGSDAAPGATEGETQDGSAPAVSLESPPEHGPCTELEEELAFARQDGLIRVTDITQEPVVLDQVAAASSVEPDCRSPSPESLASHFETAEAGPVPAGDGEGDGFECNEVTASPEHGQAGILDCIDELSRTLSPEHGRSSTETLERFSQILQAVAEAAEAAGLPGLIDVCALVTDRIEQPRALGAGQDSLVALLTEMPLVLMDYAAAPEDPATGDALLSYLQNQGWGAAMRDDEVELLRLLLRPAEDLEEADELDAIALLSAAEESVVAEDADTAESGEICGDEQSARDIRGEESLLADAAPPPENDNLQDDQIEPEKAARIEVPVVDPDQRQSLSPEMLALAAEEFETNCAGLEESLSLARHSDAEQRLLGWGQLQDELALVAAGAEAIGLSALAQLLLHKQALLAGKSEALSIEESALAVLARLPDGLRGYLAAPADPLRAAALVQIARDLMGEHGSSADWAAFEAALANIEIVAQEIAEEDRRAVVADAEDVSLALPDDINQELLDGLLTELPIQTSAFTEAVQRIASGHGKLTDIDIAKRAAHTLKGAANTVGVRGIANLTHHLEDVLIALAEHNALPNLGLSQTLGYAADCLEGMSEALVRNEDAPNDAVNVLQDVLNWANRIDSRGPEVAAAERPSETSAEAESAEAHPSARLDPSVVPMLRVPTTLVDEQLRLVGESMTSTAQIQNRLLLAIQQAKSVSQQNSLLRQLVNELEDLVDLRGIALPQQVAADTGFDALEFDQFGELHTVTRRLVEVATDSSEMGRGTEEHLSALSDLIEFQSRLQLESQNAVMRARMVPVTTVVSRLQRAVRQAGRLLDKDVDLVLKGADTLVDGNVLNELVDALMHVLRNAVDHGIESAEERVAAGKDPVGHIHLSFRREGDFIAVSCRDDGQGLDLEQIRRMARRKNLIGAADAMTDDQVARLVLASGFSTRDEATQVSGRGIGLDAVNAMVQGLKGSLNLHTRRGKGLSVDIRLPTTLLSAQALLVRVCGKTIALATRGIEEIHFVTENQLQRLGNRLAYRRDSQLHDVLQLETLLNLGGEGMAGDLGGHPLLMVRLASGAFKAVIVEEVTESRSLVVKKLGAYVGKIGGVIGATILGDGGVAPVIDLPDLLGASDAGQSAGRTGQTAKGGHVDSTFVKQMSASALRALVVDDSISARRTTAQLIKDAGFEVQTAIDGLDAVAILDKVVPDVIITDMEMPRMNGLELTGHVRARDATKHVPVIMITSRSTEKHRQQAEAKGVDLYLTKPFSPELLLKQVGTLAGRRP